MSASPTAEAQSLLDHGRVDEALKTLNALASVQPEPAAVDRLLGMAYYEQGQIQPSAPAFQRALVRDPGDREAMQMEGVAFCPDWQTGTGDSLAWKGASLDPGQ